MKGYVNHIHSNKSKENQGNYSTSSYYQNITLYMVSVTAFILSLLICLVHTSSADPNFRFAVLADSRGLPTDCVADSVENAKKTGCINNSVLTDLFIKINEFDPDFTVFPGDMVYGKVQSSWVVNELIAWKDIIDLAIGTDNYAKNKVLPVFGGHERCDDPALAKWHAFDQVFDPVEDHAVGGMDCYYFNRYEIPVGHSDRDACLEDDADYGHTVYYCDFQTARFFVLNNDYDPYQVDDDIGHEIGPCQRAWLSGKIADKPYNFLFHHEPAYGTSAHGLGNISTMDLKPGPRNDYIDVIANLATMVFVGHEHQYTRRRIDQALVTAPINLGTLAIYAVPEGTGDDGPRNAWSYDSSPAKSAVLHIEWVKEGGETGSYHESIAHFADDAEQHYDLTRTLNLESSDLDLMEANDGTTQEAVGMRWVGLDIPREAIITDNTYIQFIAKEDTSALTSIKLCGENKGMAREFAEVDGQKNYSLPNRVDSSNCVDWDNVEAWETNSSYQKNIRLIVQKIVDRRDWGTRPVNQIVEDFMEIKTGGGGAPWYTTISARVPANTGYMAGIERQCTTVGNTDYWGDDEKPYHFTIVDVYNDSVEMKTYALGRDGTLPLIDRYPDDGLTDLVSCANLGSCVLGPKFEKDILTKGGKYYTDRDYFLEDVPIEYEGMELIKTPNDERNNTSASDYLTFELDDDATVYVAYDSRAKSPPDWLENNFDNTGKVLLTSLTSQDKLEVYSRPHSAGDCINLGGNKGPGFEGNIVSNYIVFYGAPQQPCVLATKFQETILNNEIEYYTDRTTYKLTSVPSEYVGMDLTKTPNEERDNTSASDYLTFELDSDATVYVAYDSRATSRPDWMADFSNTGNFILTSLSTQPRLEVYSRSYFAGDCINLGGNKGPGFEGNIVSNYIVFYGAPQQPCVLATKFQETTLNNEIEYYTDRTAKLTSVPSEYVGMDLIKTPNNDRLDTSASDYLTFELDSDATVYVAYDSRATSRPDWMADFSNTGNFILTSLSTQPRLEVYSRSYFAGDCINLGGNKGPGFEGNTVSNYIVFYGAPQQPCVMATKFQETTLNNEIEYYTDRPTYKLTSVPSEYVGMDLIKTPNEERDNTSASDYLTFELDSDATVYVAYDSRATSRPDWMADFSNTGNSILTSLSTQPRLEIYSRSYFAGDCINLGGNKGPGFEGNTVSNYIVFYGAPQQPCVLATKFQETTLNNGIEYYTDRPTYKLTSVPSEYVGMDLIKTPNEERDNMRASAYLTFELDSDATVYVAYDSRATNRPDWMADFSNTGNIIETSLSTQPRLEIYSRSYFAGDCVNFGGNKGPGFEGNTVSNYIVFYDFFL